MSKSKARRNRRRFHRPEVEKRAALYAWRDEMAKALLVMASASPYDIVADVKAGRLTPTEAVNLAPDPLELWNNPPQPLTESEKYDLVFGEVPKRRSYRRAEKYDSFADPNLEHFVDENGFPRFRLADTPANREWFASQPENDYRSPTTSGGSIPWESSSERESPGTRLTTASTWARNVLEEPSIAT